MSSLPVAREKCVKKTLDIILLNALDMTPKCGYELITHVHRRFDVRLSPGTIYPLLGRLEARGFLQSDIDERRRRYRLTSRGKDLWRLLWSEYNRVQRAMDLPSEQAP
ncbi:MAG: PadR family transcriptional regulator [Candidatus Bathyarchaeia archaeon]